MSEVRYFPDKFPKDRELSAQFLWEKVLTLRRKGRRFFTDKWDFFRGVQEFFQDDPYIIYKDSECNQDVRF